MLLVDYQALEDHSGIRPVKKGLLQPIIYENPGVLQNLDPELRKMKFIDFILPAILIAKYEIRKENIKTIHIWGKLKSGANLSAEDSSFMEMLFEKYDSRNFAEIHLKQQVHPNSIIIAQAALETGWGTSRFFIQGNNAFGIWSYNSVEDRIPSSSARGNIKIYLRQYDNILGSVNDYFLTISRSWAFDTFRKKRGVTDNAYELIWYLNKYSELRNDYVKKIGELMITNELSRYDSVAIDPANLIYLDN